MRIVPAGYSVGRVVWVRVMRDWVMGVVTARHNGEWIDVKTESTRLPIGIHASAIRQNVRLGKPPGKAHQ